MTVRLVKIGQKDFILLARRDFAKLAAQADRQMEDDYWTRAALQAESEAQASGEKAIPFERVERELQARKGPRGAAKRRRAR